MGSQRIDGKALSLTFGGTDYWADITSVTLSNDKADSDVTTFEDAANGGAVTWKLAGTGIASTDSDSFWSMVWSQSGTDVAYRLAPNGNTTAQPDQPHFTGTLNIGPKPPIGGDAGKTQTFDFEFTCNEEPTLDRGSNAKPTVSSVAPNTGVVAGKPLTISGTRFTGTTAVKFDTTTALFDIISDTIIVAVAPTGLASGTHAVTVTNAAGVSTGVNVTV